nr:MAG TPA: hypothetical protein [Inoviridae sp.]
MGTTFLFGPSTTLLFSPDILHTHNHCYVKSLDGLAHPDPQSKHPKCRHRSARQHISRSSTSLCVTPASSRRFFWPAILR